MAWIIMLGSYSAFAQVYHVNTIATNNGLISNHVNDMAQDDLGYMWVSSDKGLSRFDGIEWINYGVPADIPTSMNSSIRVVNNVPIVSGNNNNYYFSAWYFKNEQWTSIPFHGIDTPRGQKFIWETSKNGESFLYHFLHKDTLNTYFPELKSWSSVPLTYYLQSEVSALKSYQEQLFVLSAEGVHLWTGKACKSHIKNQSEYKSLTAPYHRAIDLVFANDSTAYLIGDNWLGMIESGIFTLLYREDGRKTEFKELNLHPKGYLFFRSNQKYFWYHIETNQIQTFLTDNEDIHAVLSKMYIDRMGTLWISSYRGLHAISNFLFLTYRQSDGLPKNEVSLIQQLKRNRVLVAGVNGYAVFENENIVFSKTLKHSQDINIRFLAGDTLNGQTYVVAQNLGLGRFNENTMEFDWMNTSNISLLAVKNVNDTLWMADNRSNIYYLSNNGLKKTGECVGFIRSIKSGSQNEVFLCTTDGVTQIQNNTEKLFNKCKSVSIRSTYSLIEVNDSIYVGTEAGLAKLHGEDSLIKTTYQGFEINNPIYAIFKDNDNAVWFGTDNGVYVIRNGELYNYSEAQGLLGSEVNRSALMQTHEGKILIGTNRALNVYTQLSLTTLSKIFPLRIKRIKANEKSLDHPWQDLHLASNTKNINIAFEAVSLNNEQVEFRYKLVGLEGEWQYLQITNTREVTYYNIPSGKYHFEIQYKLMGQEWSLSTLSNEFTIAAPFYLRWWFVVLLVFMVGTIGYFTNQVLNQFKLNQRLKETIRIKIKEVRDNESKLKLALENSRLGVWSYDLVTGESEYTQEVYNFLDLSQNSPKLLRENYLLNFHPDDADKVHKTLKDATITGMPYDVEFRAKQQNDTYKWLHGKGKCIFNEQGQPIKLSGTLSDISRRKNFEAERERLIHELKRANEELDRFVYSVSHDLSAPIKSIKGLINLTRMAQNSEEVKSYINLIETSVEKQDKFIKEIMDYAYNARKEVHLERVNLYQITQDVIEGLAFSNYDSKESVKIEIEQNLEVTCDRLRLRIILNNLISNAIKFKRFRRPEEHQVIVSAAFEGEVFSLSVKDNGMGIDQTSLDKIFNMFYRATDSVSGSGLGLYIAKDAAEKMGCKLRVESKLGEGSVFSIVSEQKVVNRSVVT